jgi:hypothetical protein
VTVCLCEKIIYKNAVLYHTSFARKRVRHGLNVMDSERIVLHLCWEKLNTSNCVHVQIILKQA